MKTITNTELIQKLVEKSLTGEEKMQVIEKLNTDPEFKNEFLELRDQVIALRAAVKLSEENAGKKPIMLFSYKYLSIAASVVILIGLSITILLNSLDKNSEIITKLSFEDIKNIDEKILLSENFQPDFTLENTIYQQYRSPETTFEIISPLDSTIFNVKEDIIFNLTGEDKIQGLIIYNNKSEIVFEKHGLNQGSYNFENALLPGVYYWQIIVNNQKTWGNKLFIIDLENIKSKK